MVGPIGGKPFSPTPPPDQAVTQLAAELRGKIDKFKKGIEAMMAKPQLVDDPTQLNNLAQMIHDLDAPSQKAANLKG